MRGGISSPEYGLIDRLMGSRYEEATHWNERVLTATFLPPLGFFNIILRS